MALGARKSSNAALESYLRDMHARGLRILEHPKYGGVNHRVHVAGSWHGNGAAADINYGPSGAPREERAVLIWAARLAEAKGLNAIYSHWRQHPLINTRNNHWDHLHVDVGHTFGFTDKKPDAARYRKLLATPVPGFTRKPRRLPTIRRGGKNYLVRLWQEFLIEHRYLGGKPDSIFGSKTEAATKAFQKEHSLVRDGVVGPKTWYSAIYGLRKGSRGADAKIAQRILGYTGSSVDGVLGSAYVTRAKELQRWLAVPDDAALGAATIRALIQKG